MPGSSPGAFSLITSVPAGHALSIHLRDPSILHLWLWVPTAQVMHLPAAVKSLSTPSVFMPHAMRGTWGTQLGSHAFPSARAHGVHSVSLTPGPGEWRKQDSPALAPSEEGPVCPWLPESPGRERWEETLICCMVF